MRLVLLVVTALSSACATASAGERYSGFLTFGCGDSYMKVPGSSETWFVDLPPRRQQRLFELANLYREEHNTWWTLGVELEGRVESRPRRGYFFDHPKTLHVTRIVSAQYPELGESVRAATTPAQGFRGYLVLGDETAGFAPVERGNELWWISPGKVRWDQIKKMVPPTKEDLYGAFVELIGRVGPPGAFGHLQTYNREILVDALTYLRPAAISELTTIVAIRTFGAGADIEKCKPQRG